MADGYQDKRVERSKAAVLAEAYRQLTQSGMSGVSIDDIARESGVAKTTIYRHWPTRSALLIDACSRMGAPQPTPDRGSLRDDLLLLVGNVAKQLPTAGWASVLPSIIDAGERDEAISAMQTAMHETNMTPFYAVIERGRERGEVAAEKPAADLIAAVMGPLFYRRWFSKEPIDDRFVNAVVDAAIASATADPTGSTPDRDAGPSPSSARSRSRDQRS